MVFGVFDRTCAGLEFAGEEVSEASKRGDFIFDFVQVGSVLVRECCVEPGSPTQWDGLVHY